MSAMIYTLAVLEAKRRVKDRIRKAGQKLHEYKAKEIMAMAHQYAEEHRAELIANAKASIEMSADLKKLWEKEQRMLRAHTASVA
jgi:hypothetical protein